LLALPKPRRTPHTASCACSLGVPLFASMTSSKGTLGRGFGPFHLRVQRSESQNAGKSGPKCALSFSGELQGPTQGF
jgi:hypothetical protein